MPFNDSVERPTVKKKPSSASANKIGNLVKLTALGLFGFGAIIMNSLLPVTAGEDPRHDSIAILAGLETTANCAGTGCVQPIVGITESMDVYNMSGSYSIGKPSNPICELSSTGALQGSACAITPNVTLKFQVAAFYVAESGSTLFTGSGKAMFVVPRTLSGFNVTAAHLAVGTAGTTNTSAVQLRNAAKGGRKIFSTVLSIDSAETGSDTAATPVVINTANDDVGGYDRLFADITALSTTKPKGDMVLTLEFTKP